MAFKMLLRYSNLKAVIKCHLRLKKCCLYLLFVDKNVMLCFLKKKTFLNMNNIKCMWAKLSHDAVPLI